jgi:hypothetical protein
MAVCSTHMTSSKFLINIRLYISLKAALFVKTVMSAARNAVQERFHKVKFEVK